MNCYVCGCSSKFDECGDRICGCDTCIKSGCPIYTTFHLNAIKKISKWWKSIPGCVRCGIKPRIDCMFICELCYHNKHMDECLACTNNQKHYFGEAIQHRWDKGEW